MDSENVAKPFCQQQTCSEGRQFVHRLLLVRWWSKERRSGNGLGSESSPCLLSWWQTGARPRSARVYDGVVSCATVIA